MATQTGSTYISESMTDIIKIPTANLGLSTKSSSKKVLLGDSNNDRQPEMAAETGNNYNLWNYERHYWFSNSKSGIYDYKKFE